MTNFSADLNQMCDLAGRLDSVVNALQDEAHGGIDAGVLGDSEAVSAMEGFISGWSHGRSEITSGVDTVRSALRGAAGNYERSDQGMAAKLRPAR